jgi:SNF2 family DNA or RNA helicase
MHFLIPPWKHQLEAIKRATSLPDFALFFEMGTGKTGTAINILRTKFNTQKRVYRTLVFCPPIVVSNWKDEWAKHSTIDPDKIVLLQGTQKKRVTTFLRMAYSGDTPVGTIFVTNYESLLMADLYPLFKDWRPECVIADEAHRIKSPTSKRSKALARLVNQQKPRPECLILTGSPILNSPMDIFQQFLVLDGGKTFGDNFFVFRARYFRDRNAGMPSQKHFPDWQIIPGAYEEIAAKIAAKSMRVMKADCLDLPPLVRKEIKVAMAPKQRELYEAMKKDLIAVIDASTGQASMATLAITKALRLQQIASGYIKTTEGEEIAMEDNPKAEALAELLEDLRGKKVIVWAVWKQNYEQIKQVCDKLKLRYTEVHGGVGSSEKNQANAKAFNTDPSIDVLIGHPGSGGIGINLVAAPYAIFYSRSFSLDHDQQAEARNHRGGSEIHDKVTRIDLVTENSIDELVLKKLADKVQIGEKLLTDLSAELKKERTK